MVAFGKHQGTTGKDTVPPPQAIHGLCGKEQRVAATGTLSVALKLTNHVISLDPYQYPMKHYVHASSDGET